MKPKHILIIVLIVLTSCSLVIISKNIRKAQNSLESELQSTNTQNWIGKIMWKLF